MAVPLVELEGLLPLFGRELLADFTSPYQLPVLDPDPSWVRVAFFRVEMGYDPGLEERLEGNFLWLQLSMLIEAG